MNRKNIHFKEWLKVDKELDVLEDYKRNQNWIPLDTPYKSGYYIYFDLRDDIKNRADSWVFEKCIQLVANQNWCRDKSMTIKKSKGCIIKIQPSLGVISEEIFKKLHPAVQKYFSEVSHLDRKNWNPYRKRYYCNIPSHYLVHKIKPRWITHYREIDSVIEKQISEKKDFLWKSAKMLGVGKFRYYSGAPKSFCKIENRSDRAYNKRMLKRNIDEYVSFGNFERYEYRYNHKHSAAWKYW